MLSGCDELQFPKSQSSPTIPQKLPHQAFPARQGDELQVKFFKFFFSEKKKRKFFQLRCQGYNNRSCDGIYFTRIQDVPFKNTLLVLSWSCDMSVTRRQSFFLSAEK